MHGHMHMLMRCLLSSLLSSRHRRRSHLDAPPYLIVPPNHRVQLPVPCSRRQVPPVPAQRLVLPLGVLVGHTAGEKGGAYSGMRSVSRCMAETCSM